MQVRAERGDDRQQEQRDEQPRCASSPSLPREPDRDREQRQPQVGAVLGVVASERRGRPVDEPRVERCQPRRHDEVQQICREEAGGVERAALEVRQRIDEQRARQDGRDEIGDEQRAHERGEPAAACGDERQGGDPRDQQGECEREQQLGREQELNGQQRAEPEDEPAIVERPLDVADHEQCRERHEEHRAHVQVPLQVAELVAREAEQVAAGERGPVGARHVPAE